jgi:hypothetical protein
MDPDKLSLAEQLAAFLFAAAAGRFLLRSRQLILLVSAFGAILMMAAHINVDGQGAFLFVFFLPIIYCIATFARRDLDRPKT